VLENLWKNLFNYLGRYEHNDLFPAFGVAFAMQHLPFSYQLMKTLLCHWMLLLPVITHNPTHFYETHHSKSLDMMSLRLNGRSSINL
jgi:hypothetical protein